MLRRNKNWRIWPAGGLTSCYHKNKLELNSAINSLGREPAFRTIFCRNISAIWSRLLHLHNLLLITWTCLLVTNRFSNWEKRKLFLKLWKTYTLPNTKNGTLQTKFLTIMKTSRSSHVFLLFFNKTKQSLSSSFHKSLISHRPSTWLQKAAHHKKEFWTWWETMR